MFQDNSQVSGASATKSDFDFVDTVERLNEGVINRGDKGLYNNPEVVSLRDQLQAARIAERRWSKSSPKLVLETYQRLGRHRLIRMEKVPAQFTSIQEQIENIKVFRRERVAALKDK